MKNKQLRKGYPVQRSRRQKPSTTYHYAAFAYRGWFTQRRGPSQPIRSAFTFPEKMRGGFHYYSDPTI